MSEPTQCSGHVWEALDGYPARCSVCGSMREATADSRLAEAIERVRLCATYIEHKMVCDAAAREAQCRAALRSAEEECAMLQRERDEARAKYAALDDYFHRIECSGFRATIAGIERLLIRGYELEQFGGQFWWRSPFSGDMQRSTSLVAAVQAALAELDKEPK